MHDAGPRPDAPVVVAEALAKGYYKSFPFRLALIATTSPNPFDAPTSPEAYSVLKELVELGDHCLSSAFGIMV